MKNKSKIIKNVAVICLLALFMAVAVYAGDTFPATRSYTDSGFTDVSDSAWYYNDVKSAYELSLISGMGAGIFAPDSTMTVAQGITLAARMNAAYNNIKIPEQTGTWYDVYVTYAKEKGILSDGQFDSLDRAIKRQEMASLFAKALPASYYNAINAVTKVPDVMVSASYYKDVFLLYNAGIIMGSDAYGTFNPEANIKRSEVSAIINRVAIPTNRLKKTLALKSTGNGYYLAADSNYSSSYSGIASGWSYDNRGGAPKTSEAGDLFVNDISKVDGTGVIRDLTYTDSGVVTLETSITFLLNFNGFYLTFLDQNKNPAYKLYTENDALYVLDSGNTPKKLFDNDAKKSHTVRLILDFNTGTCETIIDWQSYGKTALLSNNILTYKLGSTDDAVISVKQGPTNIYVDYAVNEDFSVMPSGTVPYGWTANKSSDEAQSATVSAEYVLKTPATGGTVDATRPFEAVDGKVCYESLFFMPTLASGFSVSLTSNDLPALEFSTKDGSFYANGTLLRAYQANMWYRLRFEVDLNTQIATIKVNGKKVTDVNLLNAVTSVNTLKYNLNTTSEATIRLDDIKISKLVDYDDYISEPVKPAGEENYNIGVNVCSLWRNGTHGGWDCITPFDEVKPLLGYYDEGLPEVADWEIKWMAEHGIDFQLFCWYASQSNAPIKTTGLSAAIHDGYFNAKYSDKVKFALLWEAANAAHPAGSEAFRKYFVPYWVEYFFTDDRYMTIDNKLVIAVFGPGQLIKDFGSAEAVKAEFDYVREVAKTLGFDGAIFMACSGNTQQIKDCGFDACYAYNWGKEGSSSKFTIQQMTNNQDAGFVYAIPTVSTGFNNVAWAGTRSSNMTVADYKATNEWVRDVALKKYENSTDTWKKNFVMLSTWNEFGEGTYIAPSGLNGFGYLDTIREVYTKGGEHVDETPTANQQKRLGYLFPQYRAIIRSLHEKVISGSVPTGVLKTWNFADSTDNAKFDWWAMNTSIANGVVSALTTGTDPIIMMKNSEPIELGKSTYIKVRMKAPKGNTLQVFFSTNTDKNWSEAKAVSLTTTSDEMTDYYLSLKSNTAWKGTLDKLRIDPVAAKDVNFEIESLEILYPEDTFSIKINGIEQTFDSDIVMDNGFHMIPMNPQKGIFFMLNSYYEWNKADSVLTVYANHKKAVFTMGSKTVLVDGKEDQLTCTPYLDDGLPMLPIEYLAQIFGFETEKSDMSINIITMSAEAYEAVKLRVANEWEFNLTGDLEGWIFGNASGSVLDGAITGVSTQTSDNRWDPILYSPTISVDTAQYKKIVIAMKHEINTDKKQNIGVYFKTSSKGFAQERYVCVPIADKSSDDKTVVYELDMSQNKDWSGIVDQIRVDPFDCDGSFVIDYIKCVK